MARRLGTAREVEALAAAADYCEQQGLPFAASLRSLYDKLTKPVPKTFGAPIAGIEKALVELSRGKVVRAQGGHSYWITQSRRYGDMGATVEDAKVVGAWLGKQAWLRQIYTVDSLAFKWPNYLARAKAEAETASQQGDSSGWKRPDWDKE